MHIPSSFPHWRLVLCAASLAACLDDASIVRGELGRGTFQYTCDSSTRDCTEGHATVFPERIAVETRFDLSFVSNGGTARTGALEPASERLLEIRDSGWRALVPGTAGILQVRPDRTLEDYTFVTLEPAAYLTVLVGRPLGRQSGLTTDRVTWETVVGRVELNAGESIPIVVEPTAADGTTLAGEPLLELACDRASIVSLARPTRRPARFALVGESAGATACTLQALGFSERIEITVGQGTGPTVDAGPDPEPDASTDAGTETDGGVR